MVTAAPVAVDPATLPFLHPSAYAAGRQAALEDQAADGPELAPGRRARARRKVAVALESLGDPRCWRPEAVRANAAFWAGYADQLAAAGPRHWLVVGECHPQSHL